MVYWCAGLPASPDRDGYERAHTRFFLGLQRLSLVGASMASPGPIITGIIKGVLARSLHSETSAVRAGMLEFYVTQPAVRHQFRPMGRVV